jgi:hypothetical protein
MKKTIFAIVFALIATLTTAQSFNGVPISGDLPTAISRFKAKGYIFRQQIDQGAIMQGEVAGQDIELYILITPKTKQVYKYSIYFSEKTKWSALRNAYDEFVTLFREKYGIPYGEVKRFDYPYKEGDGFELLALGADKVDYASYWLGVQKMNIVVKISSYKQICIQYENEILMEQKEKEEQLIKKNSF